MNHLNNELIKYVYDKLPEEVEDWKELIFDVSEKEYKKYFDKYFELLENQEDFDSVYEAINKFLIWFVNENFLQYSDFELESLNEIAVIYNLDSQQFIDKMFELFEKWILTNVSRSDLKRNQYLVHTASPEFRENILSSGLQPQKNHEFWLENTPLHPNQAWLFLSFSDGDEIESDIFETDYDDDIWIVNINELPDSIKNRLYYDPNMSINGMDTNHIVTPCVIDKKYIQLYYEGSV